jgi:hypothetical protein
MVASIYDKACFLYSQIATLTSFTYMDSTKFGSKIAEKNAFVMNRYRISFLVIH